MHNNKTLNVLINLTYLQNSFSQTVYNIEYSTLYLLDVEHKHEVKKTVIFEGI